MLKSPAWWSIVIGLVGAIFTFSLTRSSVEASTNARVTTLEQQVPAMEKRLTEHMNKNNDELREDIKEIRGLILNRR